MQSSCYIALHQQLVSALAGVFRHGGSGPVILSPGVKADEEPWNITSYESIPSEFLSIALSASIAPSHRTMSLPMPDALGYRRCLAGLSGVTWLLSIMTSVGAD
jgi:hypothetical protein